MQMVPKLLLLFEAKILPRSRVSKICAVLSCQLQGHFNIQDTLRISLFLVYTLSPLSVDENKICLDDVPESLGDALSQTPGNRIWLRNQLLRMLLDVLCSDQLHPFAQCLPCRIQEAVFLALGPDWFLMFIQRDVHVTTVVLVVRLLLHFLHNRALLCKFKEGMMAGLWLENSLKGLNILMDNLKSCAQLPECSPYLLYGFVELKASLSNCIHIPEVYFLLSGLLLATPVSEPADEPEANLESMLQWLLRNHTADSVAKVGLCPEAAVLLLEMAKATVNRVPADAKDCWELNCLGHIMQFFCMVHRRYSQDPLWCNSDFLQALALVFSPSVALQGSPARGSSPSTRPPPFTLDPARKPVWDFTCRLLMEMLLTVPAHRQWHPMEMLLEVLQKVSLHKETSLSILYDGLNRAILWGLSSPTSDQPSLLSLLQTLQQQWVTIFATHNSSPGFLICLLHCLSQLRRTSSSDQREAKQRVLSAQPISQAPRQEEQRTGGLPLSKNVQEEIWKATEDIWNQLLSQRRLELEDAYKMALDAESAGKGDCKEMKGDLTPQWEETMAKAWQQFLGLCLSMEKRL
uniref:Uncharacterized protein n=1 Tax=Sphaerodactylus townsendi TaxID=933632 RepID=A0ACB8F7W5_9SAUR